MDFIFYIILIPVEI